MQLISQAEAKARDLKRYFTGKPCKHGHICERYTLDCGCVECKFARERAHRAVRREEYNARARAYRAAHREEINARARPGNAAYRAAHREERNAYNRTYRATHAEEIKAYHRARSGAERIHLKALRAQGVNTGAMP